MLGLYVEERSLDGHGSLSWDLAHHMYLRVQCGKVAVVTDKPRELLSATRKQWLKLMRQVQREQSRTLNASRILELTSQVALMQRLRFTCRLDDFLGGDVVFATADDFSQTAPMCQTAYITYAISRENLYLVTSWMPKASVVVLYKPNK